MSNSKPVKCSMCGQPIKTVFGAIGMNSAPLVCRRCFGEQSYAGSSHWSYNPMTGGQPTAHG